ncbi:MAG: HAD hydrolase-like protein [Oscillospiraceae bacterium]|nr:HAD hydrolase-like protein [Oscillospiraceae bacterium]
MSALDDFKRRKDFCVCMDSDGCAMDTMNIKHIRCFGPCMVDEWGLDKWRQPILDRWNVINLFSGTRGINRFKGLAMALGEINDRYTPISGVEELIDWADNAPELSNDAIRQELGRHPIFQKALDWSIAVNKAITALPQEEVKPFAHVREALAAAHQAADVVVVSSANPEAVREEWKRFGLIEDVDLLCTQEMGSKAYCISRLVEKGYGLENILMCGDAPGDDKAAETNSVLYFPILVNLEGESWQLFLDEALDTFLKGSYAGAYQAERREAFRKNLGE